LAFHRQFISPASTLRSPTRRLAAIRKEAGPKPKFNLFPAWAKEDAMKFATWKKMAWNLAGALVLMVGLAPAQRAGAQTFKVLHSFNGAGDGANPLAGVTRDAAGNLYGTASTGGAKNCGTVYRLTSSGTYSLLYNFQGQSWGQSDGCAPYARVVFGPDGNLYGTTHSGGNGNGCRNLHGCGTVFMVKPWPGTQELEIYRFGTYDGSDPFYGDLVFDRAGNLYGTTRNGGANLQGAVYKLTPNGGVWTESVAYSFAGSPDGAAPLNGVVLDAAGNLYGTTSAGGTNGWGTVFELKPSGPGWSESILHSFQGSSDGLTPTGGVFLDGAGRLYGATQTGGTGGGIAFELLPSGGGNWSLSTLYSFSGAAFGGSYRTLTMDNAGNLYGTAMADGTRQQGSVFKLTWANGVWIYTSLHDFTGGSDGGAPYGGLVIDAGGNIYGTASVGGAYGNGLVFEITP
jgi:uncharacterized repeat protein (TIGR03803 family)